MAETAAGDALQHGRMLFAGDRQNSKKSARYLI